MKIDIAKATILASIISGICILIAGIFTNKEPSSSIANSVSTIAPINIVTSGTGNSTTSINTIISDERVHASDNAIVIKSSNEQTPIVTGKKALDDQSGLIEDARTTYRATNLSGWETCGEYNSALSLMSGFYSRHQHRFRNELTLIQDLLNEYKINRPRDDQCPEIKGAVKTYRKHLDALTFGSGIYTIKSDK